MTKICDLKIIFSIFLILFITTVSTQNLSPVLCGGLHSGVDPCKESSNSESVLVKAQPLPKPLVVETATNQLTSRRMSGRKQNFQASSKRRPHRRHSVVMETKPILSEGSVPYITQVQRAAPEVLNIDPSVQLVPKFYPIGDPCFNEKGNKPEAVSRSSETITITPANPPKIECYKESSPATPLGSSAMVNTMTRHPVVLYDPAAQISQISSGSLPTIFGVNGRSRYSKPRGGSIGGDRELNANPTSNNIKMRNRMHYLNGQNSYRMRTNELNFNMMRPDIRMDNTMNRGINVYPERSAVIGVAPIASGVQRNPYSLIPGASIFRSNVKSLSGNNNRGFISEDSTENNGISLNTPERMYKGESVPSAPLEDYADLVSLYMIQKHMTELHQKAPANAAGNNPISKINEEKLAYGPQKIPIDDQTKVTFKDVPEEKLHIVEKPVIGFRLDQPSVTSRSFEKPRSLITYSALGFQEQPFNSPRFQDISAVSGAPKINPEQRINAEIEPKGLFPYVTSGQFVPTQFVSSEYVPTKPLLKPNIMDNIAHQLILPAQLYGHESKTHGSNYGLISEQQRNDKQLISTNNQISPLFGNPNICQCI